MKVVHRHADGQPTNPQDATRVSMPAPKLYGPFGFNFKLPESGYRIRPTSKQ